ncbi:Ppx/GppA phosphatase family protein [Pontivivens ytuae]|uniref:Ppx/GppA family phosphatase n=1 Tax=Pontivivens ytuae TaxID=2789856 RepID=A0A7S9LQS1_9RHOB|nr:Ppx/GppA phosphatase family protein [Pontivivens ytuae]QPH53502.1 Ppx/GppA family phosphatase [Pontivivens ytuae]
MRAQRQNQNRKGQRSAQARPSGSRKGRPLYAALDLGTNSCRMLIAAPSADSFQIVDAFSKSVKLGKELERTGALSDAAIGRTLSALQVCASKIRRHGVRRTRLVATEACRRASNGEFFLRQVQRQTGLKLELIDPAEEARLAVVSCAPLVDPNASQVLVIDIGGGSTELVWLDVGEVDPLERRRAIMKLKLARSRGTDTRTGNGLRVVDWISVPLGVATLHERFSDVEDNRSRFALMSWYFEEQMAEFTPYIDAELPDYLSNFQMIGTSGTVTTVGAAHLGLTRYDRNAVDGMRLTGGEINAVIDSFLGEEFKGRIGQLGIGLDRADLVISGAAILQTLLRIWPTDQLRVADRGLREGMLYAMMGADGVLKREGAA